MAELRPTQRFRVSRPKQQRHRPIGPHQPPQRRRKDRPVPPGRDRQQPRRPLNHHAPRLTQCSAHQRNPRRAIALRNPPHPFRPGPRLPKATPRHHQPDSPAAFRRQLLRPGQPFPIMLQSLRRRAVQPCQHPLARRVGQGRQPLEIRHATHRPALSSPRFNSFQLRASSPGPPHLYM